MFAPEAAPAASGLTVVKPATERNETLGAVLSPSQANTFLNCSARWWFKHSAGLADPAGGSLVRGKAVHKLVEWWFRQRLAGATPEIESLGDIWDEIWEMQSADAQFAKDDDVDGLKKSGAKLSRMYLETVAPEIEPAGMEVKVAGEIGGVRVIGYVDLVDTQGTIHDLKTAAKTPSGIGSDYAFQLATYRQLLPGANGKAKLVTLVDTKTPKLVTTEYQVSAADQLATQNLYPRVREGIREGLYFPNRNSFLCSRKYCNFCDACTKEFGCSIE
ncbi:MAG: PD-(D/E)XK nuclease family protein [Acidobacteriia bacterium]|nr:PD-(D/E)XK nuclease family protein [Terriglobia bacterium]